MNPFCSSKNRSKYLPTYFCASAAQDTLIIIIKKIFVILNENMKMKIRQEMGGKSSNLMLKILLPGYLHPDRLVL